MKLEIYR